MTTDVVTIQPSPAEAEAREAYLKVIRAEGANDTEIKHLLYLAEKHHLDPVSREIYLLPFSAKKGGRKDFLPYVSYAGLVKCAHKSGFFDGIEEELVFSTDGSKILGAKARVWTKGSEHATISMCLMSEYNKGYSVWLTLPGAMIMKCAKARALRDAFNLEGLYIEEEFMSPVSSESEPYKQEITERKRIEEPMDDEPAFE
jgi:phage recombination protein Bet